MCTLDDAEGSGYFFPGLAICAGLHHHADGDVDVVDNHAKTWRDSASKYINSSDHMRWHRQLSNTYLLQMSSNTLKYL